MATRAIVRLTCPGTRANSKVIVGTAWQCRYGIANPANTGTCPLFLVALGEDGEAIEDRRLDPGDAIPKYVPPAGTAKIMAVCSKACSGEAVLEFDEPNA